LAEIRWIFCDLRFLGMVWGGEIMNYE
jgi:hypothetical protein